MSQTHENVCNACGQPINFIPARCYGCGRAIAPGDAFHFQKDRGICQPLHVGCSLAQPAASS